MNAQLSYWEIKSWLSGIDCCVIGSGIVGLNCAIALKTKYPYSKILVVERGFLPQGASTKNAGFACFGSISELLSDLKTHSEEEVLDLVEFRYKGLNYLRTLLGDKSIGFQHNFGYEVFRQHQDTVENNFEAIPYLNQLLYPLFKKTVFQQEEECFGFKGFYSKVIRNNFEGQLDTGKMMFSLLQLAKSKGILVLNGVEIEALSNNLNGVQIHASNIDFTAKKVCVTNNAFAKKLINVPVQAVRNQVMLTEKIPDLKWNSCFHLDAGYFYFRAVDGRILIGGGRHLDNETETTSKLGINLKIERELKSLLNNCILPSVSPKIEYQWSGILGVGEKKSPIIQQLDEVLYCGVRMGGMGVAIGALVGLELAKLVNLPRG